MDDIFIICNLNHIENNRNTCLNIHLKKVAKKVLRTYFTLYPIIGFFVSCGQEGLGFVGSILIIELFE